MMLAKIILFAPLVGAVISGFGWRMIGEKRGPMVGHRIIVSCGGFELDYFSWP